MTGKVYWITGLAGAGKTTMGKMLYEHIKQRKKNIILLDGDEMRFVFGNQTKYSLAERNKLAHQYSRLCKMIACQDIDVICATISLFHNIHAWNRENIENYVEIYLRVPIEILIQRDQKQLYSKALKGEIKNVLGIDAAFEEPLSPDIVLDNKNVPPHELFELLINCLNSGKSEALQQKKCS